MKRKPWFGTSLWNYIGTAISLISIIACLHCDNEDSNPVTPESSTVTDVDGNVYQTVKIGDQWWMAKNLRVTHYRNGDAIPNVTGNTDWVQCNGGAACHYDNNEKNTDTYGLLYNWHAVHNLHSLAPEGWHVPCDEEWKTLEMVLGMSRSEADKTGWRGMDEGGKMKDTGTVHWKSPNTGATNESGFSGLPGGVRYFNIGTFNYINHIATFWSSTEFDSLYVWGRDLNFGNAIVYRVIYHKGSAFSVRCVKD